MKIYYLDEDPTVCASMHEDFALSAVPLQYAQILSTVHRLLDGTTWRGVNRLGWDISTSFMQDPFMQEKLLKSLGSENTPVKWTCESQANYDWLMKLWIQVCLEYARRFDDEPPGTFVELAYVLHLAPQNINKEGKLEFPSPEKAP